MIRELAQEQEVVRNEDSAEKGLLLHVARWQRSETTGFRPQTESEISIPPLRYEHRTPSPDPDEPPPSSPGSNALRPDAQMPTFVPDTQSHLRRSPQQPRVVSRLTSIGGHLRSAVSNALVGSETGRAALQKRSLAKAAA